MTIKIFLDGADETHIRQHALDSSIAGFTTNPSLVRSAGIRDYLSFARTLCADMREKPISFEVFADDLPTMEKEARVLAKLGANVYVKIPVTTTQGISTTPLIRDLSAEGMKLNITAIFTAEQTQAIADVLSPITPIIISIFAGRIADTGRDPMPIVRECVRLLSKHPNAEILWASTREVLNLSQAEQCGCHIITMTADILEKRKHLGKDLTEFSRETVTMFHTDATRAGYKILEEAETPLTKA